MIERARGKVNPEVLTSEGKLLGEADEENRYHLRPSTSPKPLTLKGSTGRPTYGTLPTVLMIDHDLTANAKVLWSYLHFRQGENESSWPSQTTIEAHTGMSRSTVSRATKDLERLGWLRVFRTKAGTQRWNSYRVEIPEYAKKKIESCTKVKRKEIQIEVNDESERIDPWAQNDAVKTPLITQDKKTRVTTHQSRLVPDLSSMFHSVND